MRKCRLAKKRGRVAALLLCFALFLPGGVCADEELSQNPCGLDHVTSEKAYEEARLMVCIAEFWRDGNYDMVKTQILDFLDRYPDCELRDDLLGVLGDAHFHEGEYQSSLDCYQKIQHPKVVQKVILHKLQCYDELDQIDPLLQEGETFFETSREFSSQDDEQAALFSLGRGWFKKMWKMVDVEEKRECALRAQRYFHYLDPGKPHSEAAQFFLAEIYPVLGNQTLAVRLYRSLIDRCPEQREELLFRIAMLQSETDPLTSSDLFYEIYQMGGERAHESATHCATLLLKMGHYSQLISLAEEVEAYRLQIALPSFYLIVGQGYFFLEEYEKASEVCLKYIQTQSDPLSDELKSARLIQMVCALSLNEDESFIQAFRHFQLLSPDFPELPKMLFIASIIHRNRGEREEADRLLEQMKEEHPSFSGQEEFMFAYGWLAFQNSQWEKSYHACAAYLDRFSHHDRAFEVWKRFLLSSVRLHNGSFAKGSDDDSQKLFEDLQSFSPHSPSLTREEFKEFLSLYIPIGLKLERYTEVLSFLQQHLLNGEKEEVNRETLAEAHFVAAQCYSSRSDDPPSYALSCQHLRRAMALNPERYDTDTTHLCLYNNYALLAKHLQSPTHLEEGEQGRDMLYDRAAEHLFVALKKGSSHLGLEQQLWLINHYWDKLFLCYDPFLDSARRLTEGEEAIFSRTEELLRSLLFVDNSLVEFTENMLPLETALLQLARMEGWRGQYEQKQSMLQHLLSQQDQHPHWYWQHRAELLYELAIVSDKLEEPQKACDWLQKMQGCSQSLEECLIPFAEWRFVHLRLRLLQKDEGEENEKERRRLLLGLKALQVCRQVRSEPVHLDAALDYAYMQAQMGGSEQRAARYLFFLHRIQEDFSNSSHEMGRKYLEHLDQSPNKKRLYQGYMKYVHAEKLRMEAEVLRRQGVSEQVRTMRQQAVSIYQELKEDEELAPYLGERVMSGLRTVDLLNVEE